MTQASHSMAEADKQYALHPFTNLSAHSKSGPFIISKGEGIYVWDDKGNKLIEGMAGLWCTSLGFSEPRLVDAAVKQLNTLPFSHMFTHRSTEPAIELCEQLVKVAPAGISRAFLVNSGSEAVDTALKMAWFYNNALGRPEKKKFIARKRAYHGVTIAAGSVTGLPYVQDGFDLPAIGTIHCETPHYYRYANEGETEEQFSTRLAEELEQSILAEDPSTIAAFIAEPVMGAGGAMTPPAGYFNKVQAVLKKYDILFIADEVICGFGRTGQMFGCQTYTIQPDLMTCAKQLSSAYLPIGAVLLAEHLYNAFVKHSDKLGMFGTGNTYGGHPVAAAVAVETLKIYHERDILAHVQKMSIPFLGRLKQLEEHPLVGNTRGVGLIAGMELVKDKDSKEQYPVSDKIAARLMAKARDNGLIVRAVPGDSIAICPPLIINEAQINELFDRLMRSLDELYQAL